MLDTRRRSKRPWYGAAGLLVVLALVLAACGGSNKSSKGGGGTTTPKDEGKPVVGGEIKFGLEAETGGGWCPPEAQWAVSGIQVGNAVFDPLVSLDEDGKVVPMLAQSFTMSDDGTQLTFEIRPNITFHDGTPLDAAAVVRNVQAWMGDAEPKGLLFPILFQDLESVEATGPMTVVITSKRPWPGLLDLLANGRYVIAAPSQLDRPTDECKNNPVGTGPFVFQSWTPNESFVATRNDNYWMKDADGNQLPYAEKVTFVPVPEPGQRENQLVSGQLNVMHTSDQPTGASLEKKAAAGQVKVYVQEDLREVAYHLLNARIPPFDNLTARQALAAAIDMEAINQIVNGGKATLTNQPFDTSAGGHQANADVGWPAYDQDKAKELVQQYKEETGQDLKVTLLTTNSTDNRKEADLLKQQLEDVGMSVDFNLVDQTNIINTALGGKGWSLLIWRNHPGQLNSDTQYPWWYSTYPTNFGGFKDPELDALLDQAREELDADKRNALYQQVSQRFAEQLWNIWEWYATWWIGTAKNMNGVAGPPFPDGAMPFSNYNGYIPVAGLWFGK